MNYKFQLTTKSMLLTSSGEGSVLIDADVVFHPSGFPFIPAKRIKGMLRESMEEILEISGEKEKEIQKLVNNLFGESGRQTFEGKLIFNNLFLADWETISNIVQQHFQPAFQSDFIKAYFTTEIQQTAIGDDGTALDKSLRNYRVINPGHSFETVIGTTKALTDDEWSFLQNAVNNLRYAGTRRNRGFGKVSCQISEFQETVISKQSNASKNGNTNKISVAITTLSPVVLAQQLGEQNTVFTLRSITGNQLRGVLANAFIRSRKLQRSIAHQDSTFYDIFLSGKVKFGSLNFNKGQKIPLHIQKVKSLNTNNLVSLFVNQTAVTRPLQKYGKIEDGTIFTDGYNPQTTLFFHNSRENREAGRSKENEGSIFYYESLNAGQRFHGEITGDAQLLAQLLKIFPERFTDRLGRSKSVQYGEIEVELTADNSDINKVTHASGEYILTLSTPLILLNEQGLPIPNVDTLSTTLAEKLNAPVEVKNAVANTVVIEQYASTWQSKSGKCIAYNAGSTFLIELKENTVLEQSVGFIGEWNEQGFGKFNLEPFDPELKYEENEPDKNTGNLQDGTLPFIGSPILANIAQQYQQQLLELAAKTEAIKAAGKSMGINNHLIGRLERLFEQASSVDEIKDWVKETKGKPSGDSLKKAGLVDDNHKFRLSKYKPEGVEDSFPLQKIYWITFFQTLRKKNKSNGK